MSWQEASYLDMSTGLFIADLGASSLGQELVALGSKGLRDVCQGGGEEVQGENWELQLPILESDVGLTISGPTQFSARI